MDSRTDNTETHKADLLKDSLSFDRIRILSSTHKDDALKELVGILADACGMQDKTELEKAFFEREKLLSTGIGMGLAVPHVRFPSVSTLTMAIGISAEGITDYSSLDDKPVHLIFMIAAPTGQHAEYLRLLSVISSRAKALNGKLLDCGDAETLYSILTGAADSPDASTKETM